MLFNVNFSIQNALRERQPATDDPMLQEPELQVLRKGFAKVGSLDEILEWLQRTAVQREED